jgi:hypothetical protein
MKATAQANLDVLEEEELAARVSVPRPRARDRARPAGPAPCVPEDRTGVGVLAGVQQQIADAIAGALDAVG